MKKFTKIKKLPIDEIQNNETEDLMIRYKDWDIVNDKDTIAILPYFKDDGYILIRNEYIPTYNFKLRIKNEYKNIFNYLSVIKSDINMGENYIQTIRGVLGKECGVILNSNYQIDIDNIVFKTSKNIGQYYISLLEINYNDYKQVPMSNKKSDIIKIDLMEIDNLKSYDLITQYLLLKLKFDYNIK